jgi:hypothetical protein
VDTVTDLDSQLGVMDGELTRLDGSAAMDNLAPGLPPDAITARFREIALPAPLELITLWSWRNGYQWNGKGLASDCIFCGLYLLSLDDACAERSELLGVGEFGLRFEPWWMPIFSDSAGGMIVIDCASGELRKWEFDNAEVPLLFHSIRDLIEVIIMGLERGVLLRTGPYGWEFDFAVFFEIAASRYPEVTQLRLLSNRPAAG